MPCYPHSERRPLPQEREQAERPSGQSLYSLIPPLRNEIKHLNFTVQRKRDGDYIWLDTDGEILLDLNLEKKRHQPIAFSITKDAPELAKLSQYY